MRACTSLVVGMEAKRDSSSFKKKKSKKLATDKEKKVENHIPL